MLSCRFMFFVSVLREFVIVLTILCFLSFPPLLLFISGVAARVFDCLFVCVCICLQILLSVLAVVSFLSGELLQPFFSVRSHMMFICSLQCPWVLSPSRSSS